MRKRTGLVVAVLCLLLAAACGAPEERVNAQDVMFVQMMVQHHRQGIEIARVGADRGEGQVKILAQAVAATQQDEVEMMLRWLHAWRQPLTAAAGAHDHHGGLPETDVARIAALRRSKSFERDFLTLLAAHQQDALQMAAAEVRDGADAEVKAWASRVRASREEQVRQMRDLLDR